MIVADFRKNTNKCEPHLMDARNMYWIECVRGGNNVDVTSTKYYFVTSDQKLQIWDNNHSVNQPLTLLPSQWMGLILKYVSRSTDDYKSFISFMNLPKDNSLVSEEELQSVMAGISEMTEEFSKQERIIGSMIEIKFEGILKGNIQEKAKAFAKNKLEEELEEKLRKKEEEKQEQNKLHQQAIQQIKDDVKKLIEEEHIKHKEEKERDITKQIETLNGIKNIIEDKVDDRKTLLLTIIYGFEILFIIGWGILIYKIGWDTMEMWTYLIGLPTLIFSNLHFVIKGKSFNIINFVEVKCNQLRTRLYAKYHFSLSELKELEEMLNQLNAN